MRLMILMAIPMLWACGAMPEAEPAMNGEGIAQAEEIAVPPSNVAAGQPDDRSRFTSIDPNQCRLLEENIEEGGWWRRLCEGLAGYKLELSDSDLRQDIVVIEKDGRRSELGLSELVANGAFNALGKTAEWRGEDPARPDALIVRLGVASDPEGKKPDISNLVVARLNPSACIVAVVPPGPGQNERARAIADGTLPACLKR